MTKRDPLTFNPARMGGECCVRDLRLTVRRVLQALALYPDHQELERGYPELGNENSRQALLNRTLRHRHT